MVDSETVSRLIAPLVERHGVYESAELLGMPGALFSHILTRRQLWVSFNVVDRIVTEGLRDPGLWHRDDGLLSALEAL